MICCDICGYVEYVLAVACIFCRSVLTQKSSAIFLGINKLDVLSVFVLAAFR